MEEDFSPKLIELKKLKSKGGVLSYIEEGNNLPFKVKRIYWVYDVNDDVKRGNHCHEFSHRVLICLTGEIKVEIVDLQGVKYTFELNSSNQMVYVPPKHWLNTTFSSKTILLAATSHLFEEDRSITDYDEFLSLAQM
ncbi:MAG: FdtA/QdtA family cupin domain-containing protein [Cyclobacteriaceae bacterium]|nr:FdtA/QdtA family cupin domain-containing protein [Cyclobacteriaceae bacterium]